MAVLFLLLWCVNAFAYDGPYDGQITEGVNCGHNGNFVGDDDVTYVVWYFSDRDSAYNAAVAFANSNDYFYFGCAGWPYIQQTYDPTIWRQGGCVSANGGPVAGWYVYECVYPAVTQCTDGGALYSAPADTDHGSTTGERGICEIKGNPVNILNGNNFEEIEDLRFPTPHQDNFTFKRYYNSHSQAVSSLGYGWNHNFNTSLDSEWIVSQEIIKISDGSGRGIYFHHEGNGEYIGRYKEKTRVEFQNDTFTWYHLNGQKYIFNSSGSLTEIIDEFGNRQLLSYTDGRLTTVTDEASGRTMNFEYNVDGLLTQVTGPVTAAVPSGVWVTFTYNGQNLISVTYADGSGFDYEYTDTLDIHNMTVKKDKAGHILSTYSYDDLDRVTQNIYTENSITISYTSKTEVHVTDAYGNTQKYAIDEQNGGQKRITDAETVSGCSACGNAVVRAEYDTSMNLTEKEYRNGAIHKYENFDPNGNPQTVIEAFGTAFQKTIYYTYHPENSNQLSVSQPSLLGPDNKITIWDYDDDGNDIPNENPTPLLSRIIEKGYTRDSSGSVIPYEHITTYHYNSKGQPVSIDGPLSGNQDTVTMTYDPASGNLLTVSQPIIGTKTFANYDAAGNPGSITDENQIITHFTYDGRNRITSKVVNGVTTQLNYNLAGNIDSMTDGAGRSFAYAYHSTSGLLERVTDPLGNSLRYTYDDKGNRIEDSSYDDQNVRQRHMRFDFHSPQTPGRLWKTINPDNSEKIFSYDQMGNVSTVVDELNKATNYNYDLLNRLATVTQPGSVVTGYGYDTHNNLASVTDAENHATSYIYDDLGRQVSVTSPDTGATAYTYDAAGNLVAKSDANGIAVSYTYDALNRLTAIHYPDSAQDIIYSYDAGTNGMGRLTGMTDPSGTYTYSYDVFGNLVSEEKTIEGITYTTGYTYDPTGVLTKITYPDGREVIHTLDNSGRVNDITTTSDSITKTVAQNINYLPFGPTAGLTYGNGTQITKAFDQRYQLTSILAGDIQNLNYTIGVAGNITAITDNLDPNRNQTFGYDDLYRLTSATGIYGTAGYTYDKVGNRLSKTLNSETDTYAYTPASNKLSNITGANPQSFAYDANGNIAAKGSKTLTYNQNNRLIQVTENSTVLGEYTYNGNGQRIKKTAGGETIIFHYDIFGNLIGESTPDGNFIEQYIYLGNERLSALTTEAAIEIAVEVTTSEGRTLSGINVYAFTDSGSYTGKTAVTDESGIASFDPVEFADGSYKFRADYLSYQFWSDNITLPGQYITGIQVAEETATILVTQGGIPKEGVKVYLFNAAGAYLGLYQTTDQNGNVSFDLPAGHEFKFRADILGSQFMSETISIISGGPNNHTIAGGGGTLTVTADQGEGTPIADINIYLFTTSGSYLGLSDMTDAQGQGSFEVPSGTYKVRADYLGCQFWGQDISVTGNETTLVSIPHQDVTLTVNGDYDGDVIPLEDLSVYLFTASESYLSLSQVTDVQGQVTFNLPQMDYKVRADYLSGQYWSPVFNWTDETITIDESMAQITVTNIGQPLEGINVYVFTAAGSYLNITDSTDINGQVSFRLPAGDYNFRADYMDSQYFSGVSTLIAHVNNPVNISTGGGSFTLTALKGPGIPLIGVNCYLFTDSGTYLNQTRVTNDQGEAGFDLADGSYKIRVDYLGYQFWTDIFTIPTDAFIDFTIPHQDVTVTVTSDYNGDVLPLEGLSVFLFTPAESYLNLTQVTDDQGQVTFNLPQMDYKVRADFLSEQYWSQVFNWADENITINESMAEVHVTQGATPIEGVPVYVYTSSDSYLNINGQTDVSGIISFRLPESTYKFRGDYQGNQYWGTEALIAHQVNVVNLSTGGGSFTLSVEKDSGTPLTDIPVYVFSSSGSYLGINAHTDAQGEVSFDLADGDYKFRADYFGYQFWSNDYTVPGTLSDVLTITHQDVIVTVNQIYGIDTDPLQGVNVYLFTGSGVYQGINQPTDANGQVTFNVPEKDYKVRADYMSAQYWSDVFSWQDVVVDINHGTAILHVTHNGQDLFNVPVYLFTESGSYLSRLERTDSSGQVQFLLPAESYKFRVDYDGTQYWSDVISIIANEENNIDLQLELLADLTHDPNPDRFDGVPPEYQPEKIMVASLSSIRGLLVQSVVGQTPEEQKIYYLNFAHELAKK